jgi:hypothetical protein
MSTASMSRCSLSVPQTCASRMTALRMTSMGVRFVLTCKHGPLSSSTIQTARRVLPKKYLKPCRDVYPVDALAGVLHPARSSAYARARLWSRRHARH